MTTNVVLCNYRPEVCVVCSQEHGTARLSSIYYCVLVRVDVCNKPTRLVNSQDFSILPLNCLILRGCLSSNIYTNHPTIRQTAANTFILVGFLSRYPK